MEMKREIFSQAWWLDAVAPGHWGEAAVERDGRRRADLRYTIWKERFGFIRLGVGPLSPRMGPMYRAEDSKRPTRLGRENDLVAELVSRLPRYDYLSLTMPARLTNWLPFHWLGFRQTTRYSYVIDDPGDTDRAWGDMSEGTRNAVRKAERELTVVEGDASALMSLATSTFRRRGIRMRYDESQLSAAIAEARARNCAAVRMAVDGGGRSHAGALFVWDQERVYYLVGGNDPDLRSTGGSSLVLWDGIRLAGSLGLRFDFEGSMIKPIEKFFRGFGGTPEPYLHVTDTSRRLAMALATRDFLAAMRGKRPGDARHRRELPSGREGD
jgi:hypothetical protein